MVDLPFFGPRGSHFDVSNGYQPVRFLQGPHIGECRGRLDVSSQLFGLFSPGIRTEHPLGHTGTNVSCYTELLKLI